MPGTSVGVASFGLSNRNIRALLHRRRITFSATVRSQASGLSTRRNLSPAATARANASCTASSASTRSPATAYACATSRRYDAS